jgi:hypothetical protein
LIGYQYYAARSADKRRVQLRWRVSGVTRLTRKYRADPLVAFISDRVRAAVRYSEVSVAALAGALAVPQPTLQYIVSGKTRRCRRSLLEKMAKRLHVQRRWLEGDPGAGPYVDRQIELAKRQGTISEPWELREGLPPLAELRAGTLIEDILGAWKRDLKSGVAPAPPPDTTVGQVWREMNEENRWIWIGAWLERLVLQPTAYRAAAYAFPERITARDIEVVDWLGEADEEMSTGLVSALERLLDPWLRGTRQLNYPAVYAFLESLKVPGNKVSRRVDKKYAIERAKERWRQAEAKPAGR